jgi:acyl carrier protein
MIPSLFVEIETLPLMPNGKVDRRKLPVPKECALDTGNGYVAPRTPIEEALAKIWQDVLDVGRISVKANFFALGGHSLMAVRIGHLIGKQFDLEIPLRALFERPTIEQFAGYIFDCLLESEQTGKLDGILGEIESLSDDMALSLVGAKRGSVPA